MGLIDTLFGRKAVVQNGVLIPIKMLEIEISERRVPSAFYRDRPGLWVWGEIPDITARAKPVAAGTKFPVQISRLGRDATDKEVEDSLPADHFFGVDGISEESAFCAILAEMLVRQWEGKEGDLEHLGRSNLIYLPSCVALVRRRVGNREWIAHTWLRDDYRWCAGRRVLSPSN